MKIFPVNIIADIDAYTIENEPILSINLMERAVRKMFEYIIENFSKQESFFVFAGPGNNGGDALALARLLLLKGKEVTVVMLKSKDLSNDTKINRERLNFLEHAVVVSLDKGHPMPQIDKNAIIIDGLYGAGLNRPLKGEALDVVKLINSLKNYTISIDMPSGLMGESNELNDKEGIVEADLTLTFEFPKLAFLLPENRKYVKKWDVLPIGLHQEKIKSTETNWSYTTMDDVKKLVLKRDRFSYKNELGHALLIAGSYEMMGAALLASKACMRSGVGLLTTHVPSGKEDLIFTTLPEALVSIDRSSLMFTEIENLEKYNAIGIGPGMGLKTNAQRAFANFIDVNSKPLVIDADALNILAKNPDLVSKLKEDTILTPHEGEFKRLVGGWKNDIEKLDLGIEFAKKYKVVLVLKGQNSVIISASGKCYFNSSGNAGMATAGCGDALTGVILALLAQGYNSLDAAIVGVYVHGLAGDYAAEKYGKISMLTSDLIENIGNAFEKLQ